MSELDEVTFNETIDLEIQGWTSTFNVDREMYG